jgi:hypothetical protein
LGGRILKEREDGLLRREDEGYPSRGRAGAEFEEFNESVDFAGGNMIQTRPSRIAPI